MSFQPKPGDEILIHGEKYVVGQHPAAPGIAYAQTGRQGTVYKLVPQNGHEYEAKALKVFFPKFRVPAMVYQSEQMEKYSEISGLQVCKRDVLTPERNGRLISEHGDLLYSVLMPWVDGISWFDIICDKKQLTTEESVILASSLASIGSAMEQRGIAHCDLSAPNVLVPFFSEVERPEGAAAVELVDVEQLYSPKMDRPDALLAGSAGYAAHRIVNSGLWSSYADRFAGAVILAEMLGFSDPEIVNRTYGESYFDQRELQTSCERYRRLQQSLDSRFGPKVAELFGRAWHSQDLSSCPTFGEWLVAISTIDLNAVPVQNSSNEVQSAGIEDTSSIGAAAATIMPEDGSGAELSPADEPPLINSANSRTDKEQLDRLLQDASVKESKGELDAALDLYKTALRLEKSGTALYVEIAAAIHQIEDALSTGTEEPKKSSRFSKLRSRKAVMAGAAVLLIGIIAIPGMHTLAEQAETKQLEAQRQAELEKQEQAKKAEEAAKLAEENKKKQEAELALKQAEEEKARIAAEKERAVLQAKYEKQAKYEAYLAQVEAKQKAKEKAALQAKYDKQAKYEAYLAQLEEKKARQAEADTAAAKEAAAKAEATKQAQAKAAAAAAAEKAAQKAAAEKAAKEKAALKQKRAQNVKQLIAYYNLAYNAQQGRKIEPAREHANNFMDLYNQDAEYFAGVGKVGQRKSHIYKFIRNRSYKLPDI
ncbi:hypothetical protein PUW24_17990 [Paenibacillus urinalis]|uniref:Protein kinase domain-containing protein n=1 Tax=Paenibacillus urinalis TaxID=521520 RepID=A0AAX3N4V0_9BACL|nr:MULTISPECIES: membrane protein [Paenibacillus]WDH84602.1 hypothetical protein PUW23_10480 [Paenibacillus urinalis]WDH96065.1 hypothetical protein PUW24_17990 [Paenibacillus urinalis]WDI04285.1 hypothetical protein PUW25_10165 [Paenibacillus urinalis]GAK38385.1 hypothetical protein TCA2_0111 [Paenibacillus sp. TCA20]